MPRTALCILAALAALALSSCPKAPDPANEVDAARYLPEREIPAREENGLVAYDKLWLGMSSYELAQAYNAPEGKGDGFTRLIEDYGDAKNHIIEFEPREGQPTRRLVLRVYRDEVSKIVDRRDGLTEAQAEAWRKEIAAVQGEPDEEPHLSAWQGALEGEVSIVMVKDER